MRKDVLEGVLLHIMNEIQPNFAALAKQYNCDYRTVKRYYDAGMADNLDQLRERRTTVPSLLLGFEDIIRDKLKLNCSARSIYYFIEKKDTKVVTLLLNAIVVNIVKIKFKSNDSY